MTSSDTLERILNLQRALMERVGVPANRDTHPLHSPLVKDVLIMLASEVQEALNPLTISSKPWKHADDAKLLAEFYEEVVDILFLYAELLVVLGIDIERIEWLYDEKYYKLLTERLCVPHKEAREIIDGA